MPADVQGLQRGRKNKTFRRIVLEGCPKKQGRETFDGEDLKNQKKKEKSHAKYTLLCVACKDREKKITDKLDALDGRSCRRCSPGTWRHKQTCAFVRTTKLRVSEKDLSWLQTIREKHRNKPAVTETSYYRERGL